MIVRISLDTKEPLVGRARLDAGDELSFHGWLGLLRVLSQLLDPDAALTVPPRDLGG